MRVPISLYIDHPSMPLLEEFVSFWGITTGAGHASGTSITDTNLTREPTYQGHYIKIITGDAFGQTRLIVNDTTGGTAFFEKPLTDSSGTVVQTTASTLYVITSLYDPDVLHYGTTTSAGSGDGSTLVDTGLSTVFTDDDEIIGHTVWILDSSTAVLEDQQREIYDYDSGTGTCYFSTVFTEPIPSSTTYVIMRNRPTSGGGPGPTPDVPVEEVKWKLAWYDDFEYPDASADTLRWSSEYISAGAADGSADIDTTAEDKLYVDITAAAALAAAEYGVRALIPSVTRKWFDVTEFEITVTNPDANPVWAGLSVSAGITWDASNYIRIYKEEDTTNERIMVVYNLAGAGAVSTAILSTTQDNLAFKIERVENIWRCYYSLSLKPHHSWLLALEIEDPTNAMTNRTSTYMSTYNPEDSVDQEITSNSDWFEHWESLGNLEDMVKVIKTISGSLAFMGYCDTGMAASTSTIQCSNLADFTNDAFNNHWYAWVVKNANALGVAPDGERRLITDYVSNTGTFTTDIFTANVEANDIVMMIHESVISIFVIVTATYDIVSALLITSETGGTITTDGTEQDLYVNDVPQGVYKPILLELGVANMAAGDAITLRTYKRINATGALILDGELTLIGAQVPALKEIELTPTRHGIRTTIERVAGAADRDYVWEVFMDR